MRKSVAGSRGSTVLRRESKDATGLLHLPTRCRFLLPCWLRIACCSQLGRIRHRYRKPVIVTDRLHDTGSLESGMNDEVFWHHLNWPFLGKNLSKDCPQCQLKPSPVPFAANLYRSFPFQHNFSNIDRWFVTDLRDDVLPTAPDQIQSMPRQLARAPSRREIQRATDDAKRILFALPQEDPLGFVVLD